MPVDKSPNLTLSAPVVPLDLAAEGDFWPCPHCLPWHFEVLNDLKSGLTTVREWHAADCPMVTEALREVV